MILLTRTIEEDTMERLLALINILLSRTLQIIQISQSAEIPCLLWSSVVIQNIHKR